MDPFGGKPLVYRREPKGYILYSLGENATDDGGRDEYPDGNIVVRVPMTLP